ncbi:MAG: TetR/AcrR family transcriptional regulator [Caulobacterales bacterium]
MRARLAKAAYDVIREKGHSAFRTAMVAAQAGVSQGAQAHHFATKEDLVLAALEYAFEEAGRQSAEAAAGKKAPASALKAMIADFKLFFFGDAFWSGLDITIAAAKDEAESNQVLSAVKRYRAPVYALWRDALIRAGWKPKDSEDIVSMTAALIAGIGVRNLWDDADRIVDQLMARWIGIVQKEWPPKS